MRPHSVGKNLVANTKTVMFTVPTRNIAQWNLLFAHNSTSSAKNFSAWWYDSSTGIEIAVFENYPLASKAFLKFDNAYVVLDEGDEIRVQSEAGSTVTAIITVELDTRSTVQQFA